TQRGSRVVSADPLYRFDGEHIRHQIDATFSEVMEQTRRNAAQFVWYDIPTMEELERCRRKPWMRSLPTTTKEDASAGMRRPNSPRCRSWTARLIWPCALTFCSFTPIN